MLNVDTGNSPEKPDNPKELRATWRVTGMAVVGFLIFVLLFIALGRLFDGNETLSPGVQQGAGETGAADPADGIER
jgi:hypothetical protein